MLNISRILCRLNNLRVADKGDDSLELTAWRRKTHLVINVVV